MQYRQLSYICQIVTKPILNLPVRCFTIPTTIFFIRDVVICCACSDYSESVPYLVRSATYVNNLGNKSSDMRSTSILPRSHRAFKNTILSQVTIHDALFSRAFLLHGYDGLDSLCEVCLTLTTIL
jgi:hypothetical protein